MGAFTGPKRERRRGSSGQGHPRPDLDRGRGRRHIDPDRRTNQGTRHARAAPRRPLSALAILPALAAVALPAGSPALAQGLPSANLNSINDVLAQQSQARELRQQQTTQSNQLRMQIQRNEMLRPLPTPAPVIVPRR